MNKSSRPLSEKINDALTIVDSGIFSERTKTAILSDVRVALIDLNREVMTTIDKMKIAGDGIHETPEPEHVA